MKLPSGTWDRHETVASTQDLASEALTTGAPIGIVTARLQTAGRGRFGRPWLTGEGDSLTASLIFDAYADHPRPYLIGMTVALAAAGALHAQLQWPNDIVSGRKKLGGILTEVKRDSRGRSIPVVGIGINLNQREFPEEIADRATSLHLIQGGSYDAESILKRILNRLSSLPEPNGWDDLSPIWDLFDATPGKLYVLPTGEIAVALGVGSEGQLMCSIDGESQAVLAAEAFFGQATSRPEAR